MRKIAILLFSMAVVFAACKQKNDNSYTLKGSMTLENTDFEGITVYLFNYHNDGKDMDSPIDSAVVSNGVFTFSDTVTAARLQGLLATDNNGEQYLMVFVAEPGEITCDLSKSTLSGTPLNNQLNRYFVILHDINKEYEQIIQSDSEDADAQSDALYNEFLDSLTTCYTNNKTNVLGTYLLPILISSTMNSEKENMIGLIHSYFDGAAPFVVNDPGVVKVMETVKAIENTMEGKHFTDIDVIDFKTGEMIKLSQLIEGKVALIDFWASWCRPCRGEIPYIASIHENYSKEMVVVSLNVWDKPDSYEAAVKEMNMNWTLVSDTTMNATRTYGVSGIPQIILIGTDGTILKRNLREQGIETAVKEALGK